MNWPWGNNHNDDNDDNESDIRDLLAKPIPPTPAPGLTEEPLILPQGVEPYEQGVFRKGGIAYIVEALQRQLEHSNAETFPTSTKTPAKEQMEVVIENNNIDVLSGKVENPIGDAYFFFWKEKGI